MDNTKLINSNSFSGMNKDINESLLEESLITHARNATISSKQGDMLLYQTEWGNKHCVDFPFPVIGSEKLPNQTFVLFLSDDVNSEIGIFNPKKCTYETKLKRDWLNFHRDNLITCASKENNDGTYTIYWSDGRRNPDRFLNISKTSNATEESTRLARNITLPNIEFEIQNSGVLEKGVYQIAFAYSINKVKFSDYLLITVPKPVINDGKSLKIKIDNLDSDFIEYEISILYSRNSNTSFKRIGFFPSSVKEITISNFNKPEYISQDISILPVVNPPYLSSDFIESNNEYLFRVGIETIPELDYQLKAMEIESEYVVIQVPEDYYSYGDKIGNYRDEIYSYFIQPLHKTGYWGSMFHIPGRVSKSRELSIASGPDVYETKIEDCKEQSIPKVFQVENTAGKMIPTNNIRTDVCDELEIGYGEMAYWESTDLYPDNKNQFGKYINTPIRHHKFPDECKVPKTSNINGTIYINILGIRFKNIPSFDNPDWVGYRIIRQTREGNRSVISRGIMTNMRSYTDRRNGQEEEIYYSNYGVNFQGEDPLLSETQTVFKNNKETNYKPLSIVHQDKFTFYSPHNNIGRYSPSNELKIESEEISEIDGYFEETQGHPKLTLLTQFSFWIVIVLSIFESIIEADGSKDTSYTRSTELGMGGGIGASTTVSPSSLLSVVGTSIPNLIKAIFSGDSSVIATIRNIIRLIASVAIVPLIFTLKAIMYANQYLDIIYDFLSPVNYSWQYNSVAKFKKSKCIKEGNKRRFIKTSNYLQNGIQQIENKTINNFNRATSIFIETNSTISKITESDTSLGTISTYNICNSPESKIKKQGVAYYATLKTNVPNQYGRLDSSIQHIITHNNYFTSNSTPVIFGGDCFITKFAIKNTMLLFSQDLAFPNINPDNIGYDYRKYRNLAYPRFWTDSFRYDFSQFLNRQIINRAKFTRTTTSKYNLDCRGFDDRNAFRVDNGRMYTSYNTVLEFFVESDFNLEVRDKPLDDSTYWKDGESTNLSLIFAPEKLRIPEQFIYDYSFSKQAIEISAQQQSDNPEIFNKVYTYLKNWLVYSLPAYQEQVFDNWQYFLTNNQYIFPKSEFGNVTGVHRIDSDRLMFLFENSSPYVTLGRQELQTKDGTLSLQIGDGGLFAQRARELSFTEENYGNSQSKRAARSTHFGTFYVSERQGRLFKFSSNLEEVTNEGLYFWAKTYFPLKINEYYSEYTNTDNTVNGCGYILSFDPLYRLLYVTKRDFIPKFKDIECINNKFFYKGLEIELRDKNYFDDISFTLSFSPLINKFVSFHDWHPEWIIQTENKLFTVKDKSIWLHNIDAQNPCNYYGKKYPFEIEFVNNNKFSNNILTNIQYFLESYKYRDDYINKSLINDDNFDTLMIYNNNQFSGKLYLEKYPDNPYQSILYPITTQYGQKILWQKNENIYRIDMFEDLKGNTDNPFFIQKENGYEKIINPITLNYSNNPLEREDFRHYTTRIWLAKSNPENHMIFKLSSQEQLRSPR
jgi:hypothetical protein